MAYSVVLVLKQRGRTESEFIQSTSTKIEQLKNQRSRGEMDLDTVCYSSLQSFRNALQIIEMSARKEGPSYFELPLREVVISIIQYITENEENINPTTGLEKRMKRIRQNVHRSRCLATRCGIGSEYTNITQELQKTLPRTNPLISGCEMGRIRRRLRVKLRQRPKGFEKLEWLTEASLFVLRELRSLDWPQNRIEAVAVELSREGGLALMTRINLNANKNS